MTNLEQGTRKKLGTVKLKKCPYGLPADVWKDNPALWPELEYPEVYDYLINTSGVYKCTINSYLAGLGLLKSCKPKKIYIY